MTKTSPSKLADALAELLARVDAGETAPHATLARGLKVAARLTPQGRQLVLARDGGEPSRLEATTCARHAGWAASTVAELVSPRGARCLTVTEEQTPPTPVHLEGTCGSCANGVASADPGLIDCLLGWEAHDLFWSEFARVPVAMGHGEALTPVSSPAHACTAVLAGRPGWTPARQEHPDA